MERTFHRSSANPKAKKTVSSLKEEADLAKNPDILTITRDDLYEKIRRHERIQILNVSEARDYGLGSIRGSLSIPLSDLEDRVAELDKTQEIITYCSNIFCEASKIAAQKLTSKGFCALAYEGGIEEWRSSGLATDLS
jgi:rhodanese-related sulfurtransferase